MWQLNLNVTCQHFVLFSFCTSYIKYFSQNCIKQIIFFNLGYIYYCYLMHTRENRENNGKIVWTKMMLEKNVCRDVYVYYIDVYFWTTTFVWIRIPELFGFELLWWVSKLWQPTGGPGSSCEIIILRNNSHGEIIRVSVGIFTTAVRNKNMRRILNRNTSPYFHSAFLVILPLTMLKGTHFSELSISRFSTYIRALLMCVERCILFFYSLEWSYIYPYKL